MAFSVVHFTANNEIAVVPRNWVVGEYCSWPPKKLQVKILPIIHKGILSSESWELFHIKLLGTYDTYQTARQKLSKAENESDLNSTDPEEFGRGKREKRERQLSTDSEEDVNDLPSPPSLSLTFSDSVVDNSIQKVFSSQQKERDEALTNGASSRKRQHCGLSGSRQISFERSKTALEQPETSGVMEDFSQSIISPKGVTNDKRKLSDFEKLVLREINILKVNQRIMLETLDSISTLLTKVTENMNKMDVPPVYSEASKEIFQLLPLSDMINLNYLETQLEDENAYHHMVEYLSQIGGGNLTFGVRLMLRRLLKDDLASSFSYFGLREKASFKELKLCRVIHDVAQRNSA